MTWGITHGRVGDVAMRATSAQTEVDRMLDALADAHRETLRAAARIEAAKREGDAALDAQREARNELRRRAVAAREAGASFPQIAAVLDVSTARAHALVNSQDVTRR